MAYTNVRHWEWPETKESDLLCYKERSSAVRVSIHEASGSIRDELPAMNVHNAKSPASTAYPASSRLSAASAERPINVRNQNKSCLLPK